MVRLTLTLVSLCFLSTEIKGQNGKLQTLYFHNNHPISCLNLEPLTTIIWTNDTLDTDSAVLSATSHNFIGMWGVMQTQGNTATTHLTYSNGDVAFPDCYRKEAGHTYTKAQTYGGRYQTEPEISFYVAKSFDGPKFTATNTTDLNLAKPVMMLSWLFTGNHFWSIYDNVSFTGNLTCLQPSSANLNQFGEGISYSLNAKIQVGSVKLGCDGLGDDNNSSAGRVVATFLFIASALLIHYQY